MPLTLGKTLPNLLTADVVLMHLHYPGISSLSTSYPALSRPLSKQATQLAEFLPDPGPSHPPSSCVILSTCSGKAEGAGFATTQTPLWLLGEVEGPRTGRLSIFLPQEWKRGRDEELSL